MRDLAELIKELPDDMKKETEDFVLFLLSKKRSVKGRKLKQDWAGALRDLRTSFTSLELQKKSLDWRIE